MHQLGHAFKSRAPTLFYFATRKYFTITFKFFEFLRSLGRYKVLIRVIISEFHTTWRKKNSLKYIHFGRRGPNVQTVSTSLMSKLVKSIKKNQNLRQGQNVDVSYYIVPLSLKPFCTFCDVLDFRKELLGPNCGSYRNHTVPGQTTHRLPT